MTVRVTVWNEARHEKINPVVHNVYPQGMHTVIAQSLSERGLDVRTATLDEPEHGLTVEVLENTDVLIWWGHMAHHDVNDAIVERVYARVLQGMGLIVLHSGHFSKIFRKLMGSSCDLKWREVGEKERLWVVNPAHPIALELASISSLSMKKCMENTLISRRQISSFSSAGSLGVKYLEVGAVTIAVLEKYSTSAQGTKHIPPIINPRCSR